MNNHQLLGLSTLMSFAAFGLVTKIYILPRLRKLPREAALLPLTVPHAFRFIGLSFLIVGVVSPELPRAFAVPTAYGDLGAAVLAIAASWALIRRATWAIWLVWLFNTWGSADLLNAFYRGQLRVGIDPATLGAAFYIPTAVVPPLLITHGLIFWLLLRRRE